MLRGCSDGKTRTHRVAKAASAPYTAMSVHSFYVGPGYPPVRISQWADLVAAAESGTGKIGTRHSDDHRGP
jgi:hypothetical protein